MKKPDVNNGLIEGAEGASPARPAMPWYQAAFLEDYLDLYKRRDLAEAGRAARFLARALGLRPEHRLLDLCCGPGRHLAAFGRFARRTVGLDLSRPMLARARARWAAENPADAAAGPPPLILGDMRRLPLESASFDRVVNLFTSFGYFEAEEDNLTALREIARVLRPGQGGSAGPGGPGMLAIDHINRASLLANLEPRTERALSGGRRATEERRFDPAGRRVIKNITLAGPDGQVKTWRESVRVYEPEELESTLRAAGLEPVARHGDYDGEPWRPGSGRLIILAQKPAPARASVDQDFLAGPS